MNQNSPIVSNTDPETSTSYKLTDTHYPQHCTGIGELGWIVFHRFDRKVAENEMQRSALPASALYITCGARVIYVVRQCEPKFAAQR